MGQPARTVAPVADDVGPDPALAAGRRPTGTAALVLVLAALVGELRAPAPVLPAGVALGLVALAAAGLAALVITTGVPALAAIPTRRRDGVTALVAVVVAAVGGWFGAGVVHEGRMAIHADRYRSEAEAIIGRPADEDDVWGPHGLDEPLAAFRTFNGLTADGERADPIAVAWLWDPGEDGPAAAYGVLYAPDDSALRAYVPTGGRATDCTTTVVDRFYWCWFH